MALDPFPEQRPRYAPADIRRYAQRYVTIAFLVALALHFIGSGLMTYSRWFKTPNQVAIRLTPYEKPPKPKPLKPEQFEVIEVPEKSRTPERPKEPTPLRADKNAIARNRVVKPLIEALPFSEGDSELKMSEEGIEAQHERAIESPGYGLAPRTGGVPDFKDAEDIPLWSPDLLLRPEMRGQHGEGGGEGKLSGVEEPQVLEGDEAPPKIVRIPIDDLDERPKPTIEEQLEADRRRKPRKLGLGLGNAGAFHKFDNKVSVAKNFGDFSFSTVAWDYAPYLYALRRRVYRNWFPPPAFFMGIVSGRVIVRFKIMQDGSVKDFEILSYREDKAYQSLMTSSRNAIEGSNPFPPLPSDFPDPFLEISATFYYRIIGG